MDTQFELRPGVVFRADTIEFASGRRTAPIVRLGTVAATADNGSPARVHVLSAVRPVTPIQIAAGERLPGLTVVAVETRPQKADRDVLASLYPLVAAVDADAPLDPVRTILLPLHGGVEVDDGGEMAGGEPCLPAAGGAGVLSLGPHAVAEIVRWARGPGREPAAALVNLGCFSSTPWGGGPTFNEQVAALLDGKVDVYGPPHAGVVTAARWYGEWRNRFGQEVSDVGGVREVPIRFKRVRPAARRREKWSVTEPAGSNAPYGTVVLTNDSELAVELAGFSPNFARPRPHGFDRELME